MKKSVIAIFTAIFLILGSVLPVFAADNITLTISTDRTDYTPGSTVIVSGKVLKGEKAGKGTNPLLQMKDPSGKIIRVYQWQDSQIARDGSISTNLPLSKTIENGTYTILVSASGTQQMTKINITGSTEPTPTDPDPNPGPGPDPNPNPNPDPKPDPIDPTTGPVAPKVNPVTSEDLVITGESEKGTKVIISDKKDLTLNGEVKSNGTFSISLKNKLKAGTVLYATAVDQNNRKSKETEIKVVDKTPPAKPTVNVVSDKDKKVTGKAEALSKVTIKVGAKTVGTGTADKNGAFSITIKPQKAGTVLTITTTNEAGNESQAVKVTVIDKTPPAKPTVNVVSNKDKKVSGKAEALSKVTIKAGKKTIGTGTADKKGTFSISIKIQKAGVVLFVTATDKAGNTSQATKVIVKDKIPPKTPTVNQIKSNSTKITGKAEPGANIYAKVGKKIIGSATVSKKGTYSIKIKKQKRGTIIYVYAKDKAGNVGKARKATVK
ncbi:Ig-like domain-containing protein [Heyndrickxia sp. NPDC080065]|uniref:Ig-like domain-containing protein n=1 Tax=Heyndrickxia sp. NPDC080065 TaxID=3390568 RepID=UPI003D03F06A